MNWQTTYPALATVMEASFETLSTWADKLPPPQTDVERTVMRRLAARRTELLASELRRQAPDLADKWEALLAKAASLGLKNTNRSA